MDQVTQENAALVEEATAATKAMDDQCRRLIEAVAVFRLEGGAARHAPAAPPATVAVPRARPLPARLTEAAPPRPKKAANSGEDWTEF
jgi:hypothetical protein